MNLKHTLIESVLLGAGLIILPVALKADDSAANGSYEMSVVIDRAHGDLVAQGRYDRAILRISSNPDRFPFATATNLCVAHTMVGQYRHAVNYCDAALDAAEGAAQTGRRRDRDYTTEWALAYSNRGVLRARMGNCKAAAEDFRMAIRLHGETELPLHNLARLNTEFPETIAAR